MCFSSPKAPPPPAPPPPPPPPPTPIASSTAKAGSSKKRGSRANKRQRGTLALTRGPKMGGSYTGSGVNLPT